MDKKVSKNKSPIKKLLKFIVPLVLIIFIGMIIFNSKNSKFRVNKKDLKIATVKKKFFQEWISETVNVQPEKSYFLDAIEGGIVKEIIVETGQEIKKGDTLIILTNSALELDVLNRQAQLYEQINYLRTSQLLLHQNMRNIKNSLVEIDYNLNLSTLNYGRAKKLYDKGIIALQEFEQAEERHKYNLKRKTNESIFLKNEISRQRVQLNQLKTTEIKINSSLEAVSQILENLIIKSPNSGQFTSIELQAGQSISQGERIGQVDEVGNFKLRALIDEIYISRIDTGQIATLNEDLNDTTKLKISKIYPTISNGTFSIDLHFIDSANFTIKRGQTLRIKIEIGRKDESLVLESGPFYQTTGGNWAYVLNNNNNKAQKTKIQLGRKNLNEYEILDGLKKGEKVITSSYKNFSENKTLIIND